MSQVDSAEILCLNELKQFYSIKVKCGDNWKTEGKIIYYIDKQWYKSWKEYINKSYLKRKYMLKGIINLKNDNNNTFKKKPQPKEIDNHKWVMDINEFYNDGDENNKANIILKENVKIKNLKYFPKEIWEFFINRYKGGPEITGEVKMQKNECFIDIFKMRLHLLLLPNKEYIIGKDNEIKKAFDFERINKFYISNQQKCSMIKNSILNIENKKHRLFKKSISHESIRLWLIKQNDLSLYDLCNLMIQFYGKKALERKNNGKKNELIETPIKIYKTNIKYDYDITLLDTYVDQTIDSMGIGEGDLIAIEDTSINHPYFETNIQQYVKGICPSCNGKNKELKFSCPCNKISYCSEMCKYNNLKTHFKLCKVKCIDEDDLSTNLIKRQGICGLDNIINNCFMNTAIQCLSNCWELTNYFLKDKYIKHINQNNPIGSHGLICKSYANLIKHLWNGTRASYKPINFIYIFNQVKELFTGTQQDSQEFLTLLIDELHEDLNSVTNKPYIQNSYDNFDSDEVNNLRHWYNFKRRNQSVLIELFYGQFQTWIHCLKCEYISLAYEPFCFISLPLASWNFKTYDVVCYFIFYDVKIKPIKLSLIFNNDCTVMALRNKIASILHIHPLSFVIEKMDVKGNLKYFANCNQLISSSLQYDDKSNEKPYFLFQIDPELFYNREYNSYIKMEDISQYRTQKFDEVFKCLKKDDNIQKLFDPDYAEDNKGAPEIKEFSYYQEKSKKQKYNVIYIDNNFGMSNDFLLVLLVISNFVKNKENGNQNNKKFLIFPRPIFLNKNSTCKEIHEIIYKYFKFFIDRDKIPFDIAFKGIENKKINDFKTFKESSFPYWLNVKSRKNNNGKCCICKKEKCNYCSLPYNNLTLKEIIDKYPKNEQNKPIDNTYYYIPEKFRQNIINNDFTLEITTYENQTHLFDKINDYERSEFGSTMLTTKKDEINLDQCFRQFMSVENLEGENKYFCEKCKSEQKAKKKMEICKSPHIIIIQLKRFENCKNENCNREKSNIKVNFPIYGLDMSKYVQRNYEEFPMIYDLLAVAYHFGSSNSGHYYAICKNIIKNKWYKYNDSKVVEAKHEEIVHKDAYVLFYRRRNLENILDLQTLYQSKYENYETRFMNDLSNDIKIIEEIINSNENKGRDQSK